MALVIWVSTFAGAIATFAIYHSVATGSWHWLWLLALNIPLFVLCCYGIYIAENGREG